MSVFTDTFTALETRVAAINPNITLTVRVERPDDNGGMFTANLAADPAETGGRHTITVDCEVAPAAQKHRLFTDRRGGRPKQWPLNRGTGVHNYDKAAEHIVEAILVEKGSTIADAARSKARREREEEMDTIRQNHPVPHGVYLEQSKGRIKFSANNVTIEQAEALMALMSTWD